MLLLWPLAARAHLVTSGLGPFYDGVLHLLLSPADLLGLVAAALLAGLRGPEAGRLTVIALPISWLLAGMIGMNLPLDLDLAWAGVLSFVVLGILVAADAQLTPRFVASLAALFGALHGLMNGAALLAMGAGAVSLVGITLTVFLLALLMTATVAPLRAFWARTAVRAAGSWIAAIGILMLGWLSYGVA
jgi:hydrogenase/urease accessory protein HupE